MGDDAVVVVVVAGILFRCGLVRVVIGVAGVLMTQALMRMRVRRVSAAGSKERMVGG